MTRLVSSFALTLFLLGVWTVDGAEFHIDPVNGAASGDGSKSKPWRSLQEVVDQGFIQSRSWDALPYRPDRKLVPIHRDGPIKPGDTIWLHTGQYGDVMIRKHYNRDFVTIAAAEGERPRLRSFRLQAGAKWRLKKLHISAEFGTGKKPRTMLDVESHGWNGPSSDIVIEDCVIQSAEDTSQWSIEDWNSRACNGIEADGQRIVVRRNHLRNVNSGITVGASDSVIEYNEVVNFSGDGLRGLGDHSVFQFNVVKNCYDVNENHDDGFQSWSHGSAGVGTSDVVGIVLRGNTIINNEDPQQPFRGSLQGIGCFDGMYVGWLIENNVVIVDHYHGITLGGARDCKIVNNTVIDPNRNRPGPAAIRIGKHKKGTPSSNCTVRNNLVSALHVDGDDMAVDHNIVVDQLSDFFQDAARFDFRLRPASPAINAGKSELAPHVDARGMHRPQGRAIDVGAYEYQKSE
jgi:hypothetical protein